MLLPKNNQEKNFNTMVQWGKTHLLSAGVPETEQCLKELEVDCKTLINSNVLDDFLSSSIEEINKKVALAISAISNDALITGTDEEGIWHEALEGFTAFDMVNYMLEVVHYLIAPFKKEAASKFIIKLDETMSNIISWIEDGDFSPLRLTVINNYRRHQLSQIPVDKQYLFPWYEIYSCYNKDILEVIIENFDTFVLETGKEHISALLELPIAELSFELRRDKKLFSIVKHEYILHKSLMKAISKRSALTLWRLGVNSSLDRIMPQHIEKADVVRTVNNLIKGVLTSDVTNTDKAYWLFLSAFCGPGLDDKQRLNLLEKVEKIVKKIDTSDIVGDMANVLKTLKHWYDSNCEDSQIVSISFDTLTRLMEENARRMQTREYDEDPKELWNTLNTLLKKPIPSIPFEDSWIERISEWINRYAVIQAPALAWLSEDEERTTEQLLLDIGNKLIKLSLRPNAEGKYPIIPSPNMVLSCNAIEDYKNIWNYVGNTTGNYWGGCLIKEDGKVEEFTVKEIKKRIFHRIEGNIYKTAIIGISSKKGDIEEFVCRLQECSTLPEKSFEKLLNIVVLIISLETDNKNA
ncbi:MAG: hypothetical protein E3K40_02385 [Candidatus Brocadia sp.]|nr:hypothetical protein [Candidatus Brocadia sp.]MDG6025558.1 hypothetical protein [Candidatus Brocadia sp.]